MNIVLSKIKTSKIEAKCPEKFRVSARHGIETIQYNFKPKKRLLYEVFEKENKYVNVILRQKGPIGFLKSLLKKNKETISPEEFDFGFPKEFEAIFARLYQNLRGNKAFSKKLY